tara:strand:- start:6478 stop:6846 length:369 start_codon:yes stop_codon:yes gene_type:complete
MKLKILIFLTMFINVVAFASGQNIDQNKIYKNIRCLICQGQSIADSNSEFAQTIKLVINDQIKDGKSEKEIYNFLIDKYGEWIVYNPPINTSNVLLWLIPYMILIAGGVIIIMFLKKGENRS